MYYINRSGEKAFVVTDIKEFAGFNTNQGENLARNGQEILFDLLIIVLNQLLQLSTDFTWGRIGVTMSCHIRMRQ